MAANEIHVGDIGTVFRTTIKSGGSAVDVSGATTKQMLFQKPGAAGTILTKSAVFTTDGTDGVVEYVTVEDDLDTAGIWLRQVYIVLPSGEWHTNVDRFEVYPNLE